jgi:HK97 family phage prohead protease
MKDIELRCYSTELRLAEPGRIITGVAIPYNSRSEDLGGFVEIVAPGALTRTLADPGNNVKLLFSHNHAYVLGSVAAGTLKLTDIDAGLAFQNDPPETTWANDLLVSLRRGDIGQCSFGFHVVKDSWQRVDDIMVRTLLDIDITELSIVAFPAYPDSSVSVRSKEQFQRAVDTLAAANAADQKTPAGAELTTEQKLGMMLRRLDLLAKQ